MGPLSLVLHRAERPLGHACVARLDEARLRAEPALPAPEPAKPDHDQHAAQGQVARIGRQVQAVAPWLRHDELDVVGLARAVDVREVIVDLPAACVQVPEVHPGPVGHDAEDAQVAGMHDYGRAARYAGEVAFLDVRRLQRLLHRECGGRGGIEGELAHEDTPTYAKTRRAGRRDRLAGGGTQGRQFGLGHAGHLHRGACRLRAGAARIGGRLADGLAILRKRVIHAGRADRHDRRQVLRHGAVVHDAEPVADLQACRADVVGTERGVLGPVALVEDVQFPGVGRRGHGDGLALGGHLAGVLEAGQLNPGLADAGRGAAAQVDPHVGGVPGGVGRRVGGVDAAERDEPEGRRDRGDADCGNDPTPTGELLTAHGFFCSSCCAC